LCRRRNGATGWIGDVLVIDTIVAAVSRLRGGPHLALDK
jgi:hypothetical protein